jgi:hypothetical protein
MEVPMKTRDRRSAGEASAHSFDSIDTSHEYVAQLLQVVEETATGVGEDLRRTARGRGRRREALQLVAWKLDELRFHLAASRRRLGDLQALRLILEGGDSMTPAGA